MYLWVRVEILCSSCIRDRKPRKGVLARCEQLLHRCEIVPLYPSIFTVNVCVRRTGHRVASSSSPGRQAASSPPVSAGPHPNPPPVDDFRTEVEPAPRFILPH
eukprot:6860522-Prymnesium_polylepis.1